MHTLKGNMCNNVWSIILYHLIYFKEFSKDLQICSSTSLPKLSKNIKCEQ